MPRPSIEYMNRARNLHRERGTSGGKGNARSLSLAELNYHAELCDSFHAIRDRARYQLEQIAEQFRWDCRFILQPEQWEGF